MFIGERECGFMRALREQTCAQHNISSVGAHTPTLIENKIGTNTHRGNRHNLRESAIASAHSCTRCARKLHIQRWRPNGWTDRDPNWYKQSLGQSAHVMGVGVCIARAARAARNYGSAVVPVVGEQARSARVHEWNMAVQPPRARCASVRRAQRAWRAHRGAWNIQTEKSCGISVST
jgi:hypothetical protein